MFKEFGRVVILGAAVLGGCQRSGVSRRTADMSPDAAAIAGPRTPASAEPRLAAKSAAGPKRSSDLRLIAGEYDEEVDDRFDTSSLPPAAG